MKGRYWTEEEDKFLLKNSGKMSLVDIGEELGRTYASVKNRISSIRPGTEFFKQNYLKAEIKTRPLGNDEQIPPIPGLLDLLNNMSGSMTTETVIPNYCRRAYLERVDTFRSQIDDLLKQGMTGYKIAKKIGIPKGTVYGYINEMRAS